MRDEKSLLLNVLALAFLAVFAFFIYSSVISSEPGIKLLDNYQMEDRVANAYIHKNVLDPQSTYEWGGTAEDTSANIVTSVLANYRLFDTTLEVIVLFVTVLAFGLVLPKKELKVKPPSDILRNWAPILIVFMLLIGGYLFINGHVSPGGGFPAGAFLSSAVLIGVLSRIHTVSHRHLKIIEVLAGVSIFTLAILGYFLTGSFFANFWQGGSIGSLFSGGLIPIFYTLIAFKVGAELSGIFLGFYEEGENHA